MPMKMIMEIPFPIPRSVICSPSHMMKTVPVVMLSIVIIRKPHPGWITTGAPVSWECRLSRKMLTPNDCAAASRTVP
jgi:hypothetical protein